MGLWKEDPDGTHSDLINTTDITNYITYDHGKPIDKDFYCNDREVFDWAISRGGTALPKKSYRTMAFNDSKKHDGTITSTKKRNLIAMNNYEKCSRANEGEIKNYYVPPKLEESHGQDDRNLY